MALTADDGKKVAEAQVTGPVSKPVVSAAQKEQENLGAKKSEDEKLVARNELVERAMSSEKLPEGKKEDVEKKVEEKKIDKAAEEVKVAEEKKKDAEVMSATLADTEIPSMEKITPSAVKEYMFLSQYGTVYVAPEAKERGDMMFTSAAPLMIHLIKTGVIPTEGMVINTIRLEYHRVIHSMPAEALEEATREAARLYM